MTEETYKGWKNYPTCATCAGEGHVGRAVPSELGWFKPGRTQCADCNGTGEDTMTVSRLMAQLDKAKGIRYDANTDLILAWFGGESTGIHAYNESGEEVYYWQVEQPARGDVDPRVIEDSMGERITSGDYS